MRSWRDGEHASGNRRGRTRKGLLALVGSLAVVASALPGTTQAMAARNPQPAAEPSGVSFTLEGCRNDGTITLPNIGGQYVCPDGVYTSGNLGKGWAELDLVPYRITADAGNSATDSQTYTVAYAVDNEDAGKTGYDVLSAAVLNTALSIGTCAAPVIGTQLVASPGIGGISKTLYRTFTVTQSKNTTCVYDFYARLAVGSHLFPGSSLHANMALPVTGGGLEGGVGVEGELVAAVAVAHVRGVLGAITPHGVAPLELDAIAHAGTCGTVAFDDELGQARRRSVLALREGATRATGPIAPVPGVARRSNLDRGLG